MQANQTIVRTPNGYAYNGMEATGLAPRESQALLLRASGKSGAEAASIMGCSTNNIKNLIGNLFYKTGANSSPELISRAFKSGFLRVLTLAAALHTGAVMPNMPQHTDDLARIVRIRGRRREFDHC